MLQKVQKGELSNFKGYIGSSDIPKEALNFLTGLNSDNITIKVEHINQNYEIETTDLNALELAFASGHSKIT